MLCEFFGRLDIAEDERYRTVSWVNPDERVDEIRAAFREALADRTAESLFHEAQEWRVPFGLVPDMAGMFDLPPHRHRGFIVGLEHPVAGSVEIPGIPFHATGTETKPFRPPLLGEHTETVLAELPESTTVQTTHVALQAAGIPAGAVMNGPDLLADPQLAAREGLLVQDRPGLGPKHYPGQPYRFRRAVRPPNERAPLLGEHSSEILKEYAGLTDDDIAELVIDDVVGTVPLAAR